MEEQKPKKRIARELKRVKGKEVHGKVGVTVHDGQREVHDEKDLDFVVMVGGKGCDHNGKHGNMMTVGIVGAINLLDMLDVFMSLAKSNPEMRAAMHAVVAMQNEDDRTNDIVTPIEHEEQVEEMDLDELINQILGGNEEEQ